eukprot:UN11804
MQINPQQLKKQHTYSEIQEGQQHYQATNNNIAKPERTKNDNGTWHVEDDAIDVYNVP